MLTAAPAEAFTDAKGSAGARGHQLEAQRLLGRQIHPPVRLAVVTLALDRRIVSVIPKPPLDLSEPQAQVACQGGLDQLVGIVGPEAGQIEALIHVPRAWARPIGRLPQRLLVAKSSSRPRYSRSGEAMMPAGSSSARVTALSNVVLTEKYWKYAAPLSSAGAAADSAARAANSAGASTRGGGFLK